jgi:hypothetical protein
MKTIMDFLNPNFKERLSRIEKIKKFYNNKKLHSNVLTRYVDRFAASLKNYSKKDLKTIPKSLLNEYKDLKEATFNLLH